MIALIQIVFFSRFVLGELDITDIRGTIEINLDFLENVEYLDTNATDYIIVGASELLLIQRTVPNMSDERKELVQNLADRFMAFLDKALVDNQFGPEYDIFYKPIYWVNDQNFGQKYRKGKISKAPFLDLTLEQIHENSVEGEVGDNCTDRIVEENMLSEKPRKCYLSCKKAAYDTKHMQNELTLTERITYIFVEILFNCSNHSPEVRMRTINKYCNYIMREVKTMENFMDDPKFIDYRYYYLNKLLTCGMWGYAEFFSDDRLQNVIDSVNSDGSVGAEESSEDEINVLTAETASILAGAIRLFMESGR